MKTEHPILIQTLLPRHIAEWVRAQAALQGLSVAAWLRQVLLKKRADERAARQ